ncbi:putative isomerase YbhE [Serendipita vermifera]|nr:putative isomerase YbhE [Serendipita vermifera]
MTYKLLVGGYTDNGLRVLTFDPSKEDSNDKILLQETTVSAGSSPSWIVQHPNNQSLVFATNEVEDGRILGIQLSGTNDATADKITGELVANVSSGGTYPAHLLILKDSIVSGNYMGGSILDIPYSTAESLSLTDTSVEKKVGSFVQFSGTGPNADRQESSHPHEVYLYNDELFIPDLGADKTWRLTKGPNGWEVKGSIDYVPGAGPRHILIHDGIIYTVLELTSELSLHKYATLPETPTHIATLSTFSTGKPADPKMLAAEILLSPNKKFIYVSNRNDPSSEGDTIAVYSVPSSNETSKLIREIRTGVTHARGMNFSKDGKYLAVAGSHTSSVRIFEVLQESPDGEVKEVANVQGLEKPTAVIWI